MFTVLALLALNVLLVFKLFQAINTPKRRINPCQDRLHRV
jgi:hypothetical protein